jgi:hypothetical protein
MATVDKNLYLGPRLNSFQVRTLTEYLTDGHPSGSDLKICALPLDPALPEEGDEIVLLNDEAEYRITPDGSVREVGA